MKVFSVLKAVLSYCFIPVWLGDNKMRVSKVMLIKSKMGWFLELEKTALPSENKPLFKIITISKKYCFAISSLKVFHGC